MDGNGNNELDVTLYTVRRTFDEPIYRVRAFGMKLTDFELWLTAAHAVLWMYFSQKLGFDHWAIIFRLRFNPVGWLLIGFGTAYAITLLHILRPEGDIFRVFLGLGSPGFYSPRMEGGDRSWRPSPHRASWRFREDGSEFPEKVRDRVRAQRRRAQSA